MANFYNHELADNQIMPTNVFGVKLKRQVEAEQNIVSIMEFVKENDLPHFAEEFAPFLK